MLLPRLGFLLSSVSLGAACAAAALPENLALKATARASSEHNAHYLAKFAIDGKVPPAGSHTADLNAAWCVLKAKSGDHADFSLQWKAPISAGRNRLLRPHRLVHERMLEGLRSLRRTTGDQRRSAKGTLKMVDGPQRIRCRPRSSSKITIKFLNSYGGMNPGASEIMVFAASPTDKDLAAIARGMTQDRRLDRARPPATCRRSIRSIAASSAS